MKSMNLSRVLVLQQVARENEARLRASGIYALITYCFIISKRHIIQNN